MKNNDYEISFNPEEWTLEKLYDGYYHVLNCDYNLKDIYSTDINYLLNNISVVFNSKIPGIPHHGRRVIDKPPTLLYRIVRWDNPPENINDGSYPPLNKCSLGRCNFNGNQVFYAAGDRMTAVRESNLRKEDTILLGVWEFNHNNVCEFPFYSNHLNSSEKISQFYSQIFEDFREKINEHGINILRHLEKIKTQLLLSLNPLTSSYISYSILNDKEYRNQTCLIYPSHTNFQKGINYAINKILVDQGKVRPIRFYFITIKDLFFNEAKLIYHKKGVVSNNSKILWYDMSEEEIIDAVIVKPIF